MGLKKILPNKLKGEKDIPQKTVIKKEKIETTSCI